MRRLILVQFGILLIGFIFAWTNFTREVIDFLNNRACSAGCSASGVLVNPIYTPCFGGAIFFTIAFALSMIMVVKSRPQNNQ